MNGQGSDICIHNNNVCSLAPADRINDMTSPRSAKAVEDASCSSQDAGSDGKAILIEKIQSFTHEEMERFIDLVQEELNLQFDLVPQPSHHP